MTKCKITLLGKVLAVSDVQHMQQVEKALKESRKDVEIDSIIEEALELPRKCMVQWMDDLFNLTVDNIDNADMIIIVEPTEGNASGHGYIAWILGYAWSQGKPVGILSDISGGEVTASPVPVQSLHAHFLDLESLLEYDFDEKPFKPYKGKIV